MIKDSTAESKSSAKQLSSIKKEFEQKFCINLDFKKVGKKVPFVNAPLEDVFAWLENRI
jgi:hypothetical protein